jgi:ferredoxin-NADP reductase
MPPKPGRLVLHFESVQISSLDVIAPDVFVLRFPRNFSFKAGQVVALKTREEEPHRLYSIASGEQEDEVAILFDLNPEGLLTPQLVKLKAGDRLWVSQPFGFFIDEPGPAWWIATGTGIAPFVSMCRSMNPEGKVLIQGARSRSHFYFQDQFAASALAQYIRCSSREKGEGLFYGRLTEWLATQSSFDPSLRYYLCGNAEMVVEVRDLLIEKGVPFPQIRAEIYF